MMILNSGFVVHEAVVVGFFFAFPCCCEFGENHRNVEMLLRDIRGFMKEGLGSRLSPVCGFDVCGSLCLHWML